MPEEYEIGDLTPTPQVLEEDTLTKINRLVENINRLFEFGIRFVANFDKLKGSPLLAQIQQKAQKMQAGPRGSSQMAQEDKPAGGGNLTDPEQIYRMMKGTIDNWKNTLGDLTISEVAALMEKNKEAVIKGIDKTIKEAQSAKSKGP